MASVVLERESQVVYSVRMDGVDVHGVTGWEHRLTRLFWQVVQVVIFPVGLYRFFSGRQVVDQSALHAGGRRVTIETVDGCKLDAVQFDDGKPRGEQKWVVVLRAKGDCYERSISSRSEALLYREGVNTLVFNYRGVGKSEGYQWSDFDPAVDAEAMVQYLLSLGVSEENIEIRGAGFPDVVGYSLKRVHPELKFSRKSKLSMLPEKVSFRVQEDVFEIYRLANVVKRVFWEVIYALLLPLDLIRLLANRYLLLPTVSSISLKDVNQWRDRAMDVLTIKGSDVLVERHTIETADRVKLDTCEFVHPMSPEDPGEQKWIVFYVGKGTAMETHFEGFEQMVQDTGANVYSGNYRGVGYSESMPWRSQDMVLDGEAMLQHLLSRGVKPENILLHGWSMGGAVGAAVAAKHPGIHLCSDRSFANFISMSKCFVVKEMREEISMKEKVVERVARVLGIVASAALYFVDWRFDSVSNFRRVREKGGESFVMFHPADRTIPHHVSLHVGLGSPKEDINLVDPSHKTDENPHSAFLALDRDQGFEAGYQEYLRRVGRSLHLADLVRI